MNLALRWTAAPLILTVVAVTAQLGMWTAADARLQDLRFAAANRAPSGEIVFVDIDSGSLAEIGVWPWPRSIHADLLDRLMDLGAFEVAFDIDFSAASSPDNDAAFAASLERAGGYAFLAAFQQTDAGGQVGLNQPIDDFARYAEPVLVNVESDATDLIRSVPTRLEQPDMPSLALALAPDDLAPPRTVIDFSIDINRIVRIPASSVLDGTVAPEQIRDRQVVIGASALELRDFFAVPRFGIMPGPMVQIAAAETLKAGRSLITPGPWPALLLAGLILFAQALVGRTGLWPLAAALAGTSVVFEGASALALALAHIDLQTVSLHFAAVLVMLVRLLDELAVRQRQVRLQRERLAYLAQHDWSTGALSRVGLVDEIERDRDPHKRYWLVMVRLQNLGSAGDSLGHDLAERSVVLAHDRLKALDIGVICRIENDVFAILRQAPIEDASLTAMLSRLDEPYDVDGHRFALTSRWGASGLIQTPAAPQEAIRRAQIALSAAIQRGTKGESFVEELDHAVKHRQAIDIALHSAIEDGELDIAFQSQVDLKHRGLIGFEALLRWQNSTIGPVSPGVFIPLAEENGLIVPLGAWIMRQACQRAMDAGWAGRLSVNVSAVQFHQDDVVRMVETALGDSGFPAARLDIEITESLFVDGGDRIITALDGLRALGASIAIDDFGTGFSSLNYLSKLPIDKLKIDQSFVRALPEARSAAVVESIVSLARRLDLSVVVEGVETTDQMEYLAEIGCDVAQGYLFGLPGPLPIREQDAA